MLHTKKRFVRWAQASNDLSDIHYDYTPMRERGMPDVVGQQCALSAGYVVSMLSDCYTPDGFLKKIAVQYRHYSIPGEVLATKGVVAGKRQKNRETLVDLDVWAENQHGRKVTVGQAVVNLPSRQA